MKFRIDNHNIKLEKGSSSAVISLRNGGSLTALNLKSSRIIDDFSELMPYSSSYASAILFPFTNRILNGTYKFYNTEYKLQANSENNTNAIHGLIYNKTFELIEEYNDEDSVSVKLGYREKTLQKGFPFLFSIELIYTLNNDRLFLGVVIKNDDKKTFPFSLGWHPYFVSDNLKNSSIEFNSSKEIIHDSKMIPTKIERKNRKGINNISNHHYDNCYELDDPLIHFLTPGYKIAIDSSHNNNYVQIFTPRTKNIIAIEPATAPSNSFNNKLGLQELKPGDIFSIQWTITLIDENK